MLIIVKQPLSILIKLKQLLNNKMEKKQPLNSHMIKGTTMELPNCKIKKKRQMEKKQPLISIQTESKLLLKSL